MKLKCYYSPNEKHDLCKNKTCLFNEKTWTTLKNITKIEKKLEVTNKSLELYYKRWNTTKNPKKLEKLKKLLEEDLKIQTNYLKKILCKKEE